jgi:hypothetical protein
MKISRRAFVVAAPAAMAGLPAFGAAREAKVHAAFPSQDPERVREIVGASHARLDRVRELLKEQPALAKASWDWGFGDWETALGAASHVGNREIAELLIAHGARPDIFYHAMMGHLEVVKAAVTAQPGIQKTHGPHGITLMAHARAGGDEAKAVLEYLATLEGANVPQTNLPITEEEKTRYIGDYAFGDGPENVLSVDKSRQGDLWLRRNEPSGRMLRRVEEHVFATAGSPDLRIVFSVRDGKAESLTIHDGPTIVAARRKA